MNLSRRAHGCLAVAITFVALAGHGDGHSGLASPTHADRAVLGHCGHLHKAITTLGGPAVLSCVFLVGAASAAVLLVAAASLWGRLQLPHQASKAGTTPPTRVRPAVQQLLNSMAAARDLHGAVSTLDKAVGDTKDALLKPASPGGSGGCSAADTSEVELFAAAPTPQWSDVVLPLEAVVPCYDSSGALAKIGKGASGEVFRAMLHGATPVACKVFQLGGGDQDSFCGKKWFIQEASMLWRLSHPSVVQFFGVAVNADQGLLVMELMRRGDLSSLLNAQMPNKSGRLLGWYNRGRRIALQVASGMAFLHSKNVVHLDIKPQNVLLSADYTAKICDVGFCRVMRDGWVTDLGDRLGTFSWAAPEVLLGEPASDKADVFSFGVLLFQLLTGEPAVRGGIFPLTTPRDCPPEVAALQQRCIAQDPLLRPTAAEVVEVLRACQAIPAPAPAAAAACDSTANAVAAAPVAAGKKPACAPRAVRLDFGQLCTAPPLAEYVQLLMARCSNQAAPALSPLACPPMQPCQLTGQAAGVSPLIPPAVLLPPDAGPASGVSDSLGEVSPGASIEADSCGFK